MSRVRLSGTCGSRQSSSPRESYPLEGFLRGRCWTSARCLCQGHGPLSELALISASRIPVRRKGITNFSYYFVAVMDVVSASSLVFFSRGSPIVLRAHDKACSPLCAYHMRRERAILQNALWPAFYLFSPLKEYHEDASQYIPSSLSSTLDK